MKTRKILAGLMALTVVSAMAPMAAFAEEGTGTGTGAFEGTVDTDVFSVVLPTVSTQLNFIMDPQGLIDKTSAAAYSSATFNDGTLFFKNSDSTYSNKSDALTITNKSSFNVDVKITATVSDNTGITLTSDSAFTDDTSASLYLALQDVPESGDATVAPITENGATLEAQVAGAPDQYEVVYDADKYGDNNGYGYALKSTVQDTDFETYKFNLTGAANANGDWSGVAADVAPKANVTWSVEKHVDRAAPSIATTSYTMSADADVVVNVNLGAGDLAATGIKSITFLNGSGVKTTLAASEYTFDGSKLTFPQAYTSKIITAGVKNRDYTITFDDEAATTVVINLATA